jgi:hypothetical protein
MEERRAQARSEQWKGLRRGWYYGDEKFRQELLEAAQSQVGRSHYGAERQETAEEKARRIVGEELKRRGHGRTWPIYCLKLCQAKSICVESEADPYNEVLDPEVKGKAAQGYLWFYSRPGGDVFLEFCDGRGRDGPEQRLRGFKGTIQSDGYDVYESLRRHSQGKLWRIHAESSTRRSWNPPRRHSGLSVRSGRFTRSRMRSRIALRRSANGVALNRRRRFGWLSNGGLHYSKPIRTFYPRAPWAKQSGIFSTSIRRWWAICGTAALKSTIIWWKTTCALRRWADAAGCSSAIQMQVGGVRSSIRLSKAAGDGASTLRNTSPTCSSDCPP